MGGNGRAISEETRGGDAEEREQVLLQQLEEDPDASLEEHARKLEAKTGLSISYKKTRVASERSEERCQQFLNDLTPYLQTPARWVFLDESGFNTAMTRPYGRARWVRRARCAVPRNWGRNQTLICAVQATGPFAPLVVEGAVNGPIFEWDVQEVLCPALTPGQVVVLDNLEAHHRAFVRTRIETQGCSVLFLPPYRPDLGPIEMLFSKVKALVWAGEWRDVPALLQNIGAALDAVTLRDVLGWFTHAFPNIFCQML